MSIIPKATTVQLDVGGTPYKVSLSLIENFPDSMLASIVSNKWKENSQELIFIERDGHRFRYVLDYMRDGQVTLPKGECVESLYKDLEYFGIEYEPNKICSNDSLNVPESIKNYRLHLEKIETKKHAQARSYYETLLTIDVIKKALEKFASCSKNLKFELHYKQKSESTQNRQVYEYLSKHSSVNDELEARVNESILDLNLKIVSLKYSYCGGQHKFTLTIDRAS